MYPDSTAVHRNWALGLFSTYKNVRAYLMGVDLPVHSLKPTFTLALPCFFHNSDPTGKISGQGSWYNTFLAVPLVGRCGSYGAALGPTK
jgi:hypothetical protein